MRIRLKYPNPKILEMVSDLKKRKGNAAWALMATPLREGRKKRQAKKEEREEEGRREGHGGEGEEWWK